MWSLFSTAAVPPSATAEAVAAFTASFANLTDEAAVANHCSRAAAVGGISQLFASPVAPTFAFNHTGRSTIASRIRKVHDTWYPHLKTLLDTFGMTSWAPDFKQGPQSLYNTACRIIAVDSFKQAMVAKVYAEMRPCYDYLTDTNLIYRLYNSYVFGYLAKRYEMDVRDPGSVAIADAKNPQYKSRGQVSQASIYFSSAY